MTLCEAIRDLGILDEAGTIYAEDPWGEESDAIVATEPDDDQLWIEVNGKKFRYFIEVDLAREVLEDWAGSGVGDPSPQQRCRRLIEYAIADA